MVAAYAAQIDLSDVGQILRFGAGAQRQVAQCASRVLAIAQDGSLDEAARLVSAATDELRSFSEGGRGPFARVRARVESPAALRKRCLAMAARIDGIAVSLRASQRALMKDVALLDQMRATAEDSARTLELYLAAGRSALARAQASGVSASSCERFDRKLHDLDLSRLSVMQTGPQIRLIQGALQSMVDKIQTVLSTTIPLWKSQVALSLGIADAHAAREAQGALEAASDEMLSARAADLRREALALADALAALSRSQSAESDRMAQAEAEIERLRRSSAPSS